MKTINNLRPHHYLGVDSKTDVNFVLQQFLPKIEDSYIAHLVGNAIEYILRAEFKNGIEDYHKAMTNLELILTYKEETRNHEKNKD